MRQPLLASALFLLPMLLAAGQPADVPERDGKRELRKLQSFVGAWRGTGQVRRGSPKGAWFEHSVWAWKFDKQGAALTFTSKMPKYLLSGDLRTAKKPKEYQLTVKSAATEKPVIYRGKLDPRGKLVLINDKAPMEMPARISMRLVAGGKRLIVLYERQTASQRFQRMAEVGYTRKGSRFGKGASFVQCVVTGGKGTISVSFEGKTYYVCCGGCRDYFNEHPAEVLAEYRARKKKEPQKGS